MDKASVARVCIMFNYKKKYLFFKNLQDYVYLLCIFFQFYLSRVEGWDKKSVRLAPLEYITRALWFPFPEITLPFLVFICLLLVVGLMLGIPSAWSGPGRSSTDYMLRPGKGCNRSFVAAVQEWPRPQPHSPLWPHASTYTFVCPCHTHRRRLPRLPITSRGNISIFFFLLIAASSLLRF